MKEVNLAFTSTAYGPIWAPAVSSWLRAVGFAAREFNVTHLGKIGGAGVTDRMYTHSAENALVEQFLSDTSLTHLFMTEADMILPHDTLTKLVALDKDIATGVYFLRADTLEGLGQPCLYKAPSATDPLKSKYGHSAVSVFPTDGPFQIDCAGLGCILIKREVFGRIAYPWFDLKEAAYGSDIYFAKKARDAGIKTWCDPSVQCGQIDYYTTTIEDWKWQIENRPGFAKYGFIIGHKATEEEFNADSSKA